MQAPFVPAARLALSLLLRARREAEAFLSCFGGVAMVKHKDPTPMLKPDPAAGLSALGDHAWPFLGLIPTYISSPSHTKWREGAGRGHTSTKGANLTWRIGLSEALWGS